MYADFCKIMKSNTEFSILLFLNLSLGSDSSTIFAVTKKIGASKEDVYKGFSHANNIRQDELL